MIASGENTTGNFVSKIATSSEHGEIYPAGSFFKINHGIEISGNDVELEAGSYTKIYFPKKYFNKESIVKNTSEVISQVVKSEILEEGDFYVYKTTYGRMSGGTKIEIPIESMLDFITRDGFWGNMIPNGTVMEIKQAFFSKDGVELSDATAEFPVRAGIEKYHSDFVNSKKNIEDYENKNITFCGVWTFADMGTDPSGRRLYAKVPADVVIVNKGDWTFDPALGLYYQDIENRKNITKAVNKGVVIDLSAYNFSGYSETNLKTFEVEFELKAIDNDTKEIKTELPTCKWISTKEFYASLEKSYYEITYYKNRSMYNYVDQNYLPIKDSKFRIHESESFMSSVDRNKWRHNLPIEEVEALKQRIIAMNQPISSLVMVDSKTDEAIPVIQIKETSIKMTPNTHPSEVQLRLDGVNTPEKQEEFQRKLQGTKVYGIKKNNEKVLITNNVPIVFWDGPGEWEAYLEGEGLNQWFKFDGKNYKEIKFEFPGDGFSLEGYEDCKQYATSLKTNVMVDLEAEIPRTLKTKLTSGEPPIVENAFNANRFMKARISRRLKYKGGTDKEVEVREAGANFSQIFSCYYNYMSPGEVFWEPAVKEIYVKNRKSEFDEEEEQEEGNVLVELECQHNVAAMEGEKGIAPKNFRMYFLFPDGLEPNLFVPDEVEDSEGWYPDYITGNDRRLSKWRYEYIKGFKKGMNLVKYYPISEDAFILPSASKPFSTYSHGLNFKVTDQVEFNPESAEMPKIYALALYDNNTTSYNEGRTEGIEARKAVPYEMEGMIDAGYFGEKSQNPYACADFSIIKLDFKYSKALMANTKVKMKGEEADNFVSGTGEKAKAGSEIDFELAVANNYTNTYEKLSFLNILPRRGDKSIVKNAEGVYLPRGSQFDVYLKSVEPSEDFDVFYSVEEPKEELAENLKAKWVSSLPADPKKVTMIKAVLKDGKSLAPEKKLRLITHNVIEDNAALKDMDFAYNSFAYSVNGEKTFLEANKVPIMISKPSERIKKKNYQLEGKMKVKLASEPDTSYRDKIEKKLPEGELVNYQLTVKNTGAFRIKDILLINELSKFGDIYHGETYKKGEKIERGSKFAMDVVNVEANKPVYKEYEFEKLMADGNSDIISGDYEKNPVSDPSQITRFKLFLRDNQYLEPDEEMVITFTQKVRKETGTKDGDSALASFTYNYYNETNMIIKESNTTEVRISVPTTDDGRELLPGKPEEKKEKEENEAKKNEDTTPILSPEPSVIPDLPVIITEEPSLPTLVEKVIPPVLAILDPETTEIDFDETPRGDADLDFDVEEDEVPQGDKEIELEGDEELEGKKLNRKALAKTGGLNIALIQRGGFLLLLLVALMSLHIIKRRDEKLIK